MSEKSGSSAVDSKSSRDAICNAGAGAAAGQLSVLSHLYLDSWLILRTFSGAIAATFVCPLDVIKTRLQVHGLPYKSMLSAFSRICKEEGFRGLYRSVSPMKPLLWWELVMLRSSFQYMKRSSNTWQK